MYRYVVPYVEHTCCGTGSNDGQPLPPPVFVSLAAALRPWLFKSKLPLMEIALDEGRPVVVRLQDRSSVELEGTQQVT